MVTRMVVVWNTSFPPCSSSLAASGIQRAGSHHKLAPHSETARSKQADGSGTSPASASMSGKVMPDRAAPLHLEPGHVVNATAASAAEANNCRRADLAVIHPRCCHSRPASESPAITTSPNGMQR